MESLKTKRGNSFPRQQQSQLQGRSGGRCVTTAVLHQQLVQALMGKHWANQCPAPPHQLDPWSALKVCPTLLQRDKGRMERVGTRPKMQHFLGGLALAHTGHKVTISEKPDTTLTKVALPTNSRAQLIDRHIQGHFRKPGEKLLCQALVWFGFGGGFLGGGLFFFLTPGETAL